MVCIEITDKVIADDLSCGAFAAESVGNELQILLQRVSAIDRLHPLDEATGDVVIKIVIVADGDNIVLVRHKGLILACVPFSAGIGKTIHIQRVATKHTANRIGNKGTNISAKISLADSDILILNLRCQFTLQTININENAVQFFLVGFHLLKSFITFHLPLVKGFGYHRNFS